jgi:hypothetical protein
MAFEYTTLMFSYYPAQAFGKQKAVRRRLFPGAFSTFGAFHANNGLIKIYFARPGDAAFFLSLRQIFIAGLIRFFIRVQ